MPFKSDRQRRFMYAKHPGIAARWSAEEKVGKSLAQLAEQAFGKADRDDAVRVAESAVGAGGVAGGARLAAPSVSQARYWHGAAKAKVRSAGQLERSGAPAFLTAMERASAKQFSEGALRHARTAGKYGGLAAGGGLLLAHGLRGGPKGGKP